MLSSRLAQEIGFTVQCINTEGRTDSHAFTFEFLEFRSEDIHDNTDVKHKILPLICASMWAWLCERDKLPLYGRARD